MSQSKCPGGYVLFLKQERERARVNFYLTVRYIDNMTAFYPSPIRRLQTTSNQKASNNYILLASTLIALKTKPVN